MAGQKGKKIRELAKANPNDPLHKSEAIMYGHLSRLQYANPHNRPTKYSPEIVDFICQKLLEGIPLEEICRINPDAPRSDTVMDWCSDTRRPSNVPPDVAQRIARAREAGYDAIANRMLLVAYGDPGASTGDIQRDKLVINTGLALLSKWSNRYRDKMVLEGSKENPIEVRFSSLIESALERKKQINREQKILDAEFSELKE